MARKMYRQFSKTVMTAVILLFVLSFGTNIYFLYQTYNRSRVISVPDGDSLDLADGRRIRLLGIDAPEKGRCMADQARDLLQSQALGKHVRLKDTVKDSYGRIVAIAIVTDPIDWTRYLWWKFQTVIGTKPREFPDLLLNRVLVRAGLARYSGGVGEYKVTLDDASNSAKQEKRGIYSTQCREETSSNGCVIKGNSRAGKQTYFLVSCSNYSQVTVDLSYGDGWFCSEKEAKEAGFTRSPTCN